MPRDGGSRLVDPEPPHAGRLCSVALDGEAVCCDPNGTANFEKLQSQARNDQVFLYAFDLLELGGVDLRVEPLEERRGRLQPRLARSGSVQVSPVLRYGSA